MTGYTYKKHTYKGTTGMYRKKLSGTAQKQVKKIAKRVVDANNEHKYHDRFDNAAVLDVAGQMYNLTITSQGLSDLDNRIGDSIKPLGFEFRYNLIAGTTAAVPYFCRIILFSWFDNVTAPTVGSIIQLVGIYQNILSPYFHDQRQKFTILYDKTYCVQPPGTVATADTGNNLCHFGIIKKKFSKKMNYTAAAGQCSNSIWMLAISDDATASAATTKPAIVSYFRLNYIDG